MVIWLKLLKKSFGIPSELKAPACAVNVEPNPESLKLKMTQKENIKHWVKVDL